MREAAVCGWQLTLHQLRGQPLPPVPELPGVVHRCADGPATEEEVAEALAAGDAAALGGLLGISHARALALVAERHTTD